MNNFLNLTKSGFRRSWYMLLASIVLSIAITLIGNLIFGVAEESLNNTPVEITDLDQTQTSGMFAAYLENELGMSVHTGYTENEIKNALIENDIAAHLTVPKGFENSLLKSGMPVSDNASGKGETILPIEIMALDNYENEAFLRAYIDAYIASLANLAPVAAGDRAKLIELIQETAKDSPEVEVATRDKEQLRKYGQMNGFKIMIGFYATFAFIVAISFVMMLFNDRRNGTYRRIKSGSVTSLEYAASYVAVGMVQVLVLASLPLAFCEIKNIYTGVPFGVTLLLVVIFSAFVVSFGLLIGILLSSDGAVYAVIVGFSVITSMLGGAWFPLEYSPSAIQMVGKLTPQYWIFDTIISCQNGGSVPIISLLIVVLAALLLFVLAAVRFASNKSGTRIA
jgi:ABC-2 type transport system permease protein